MLNLIPGDIQNPPSSGGGGGASPQFLMLKNGGVKGSTNTNIVYYDTTELSVGSDIIIAPTSSSANGTAIQVLKDGLYTIGMILYDGGPANTSAQLMAGPAISNSFNWANVAAIQSALINDLTTLNCRCYLNANDFVWVWHANTVGLLSSAPESAALRVSN